MNNAFAPAQQSTACMASHNVEERLCRWLLRARNLAECDTLNFTQEFLAEMPGVRRTGVTMAAYTLQAAGMISDSRGKIKILDVHALQCGACECYAVVNTHDAELPGAIAIWCRAIMHARTNGCNFRTVFD